MDRTQLDYTVQELETAEAETYGFESPSSHGVTVNFFIGEDGIPVVQIDTEGMNPRHGQDRIRVNLNDAPIWDGNPETDSVPGAYWRP